MDFYISKEEIVKSLNVTLGLVEKTDFNPISSCVLFEVDESCLKLTATDKENNVSTISTITNFTSGGITAVPARKLSDLCRLLPEMSEIHFFLDGYDLKIETKSGKYKISTMPSEDFPIFGEVGQQVEFSISSKNLKSLISHTAFAISTKDVTQPIFGLGLSVDDKTIQASATCSSRIAIEKIMLNEAVEKTVEGIVPKKAINEIGKLVAEETDNVLIGLGSNRITVNVSGTTFSSKLLEGRYPPLEEALPNVDNSKMVIDKKMLLESLSRVMSLSELKAVKFIVKENMLNISPAKPEQNQGEENLACEYKGNEIEIDFNTRFIQDIVSAIESENINIMFADDGDSCLITDPNSENLIYAVTRVLV